MHTNFYKLFAGGLVGSLLLCGCANNHTADITANDTNSVQTETVTIDVTTIENNEEDSKMTDTTKEEAIAEAIRQETADVANDITTVNTDEERIPTATIDVSIPTKYTGLNLAGAGRVEHISYTSYDYFGNESEVTKEANVYLPKDYDENKQYNVLYLMHGIGGDENEWKMTGSSSKVKIMMDNLIYYGDIEPFIVVTPNGRSAANHAANGSDFNSFYCFGKELRNDLIPYIESHYATYANYDESGYDLSVSRDHRAMAGLSMGGMQTINIGIGECIDLFGYFGAFSAAPTSNPAEVTAKLLADNDLPIHYFYNICGTEDGIAYGAASAAAKNLPDVCDQFAEGENFMWQELPGQHDFNIWFLGFYNFAQLAFQE